MARESNNSNSVKSIEIPPPRPKRKPAYPYPRKLVLPAKKGLDQENQSPNSVLSAFASDNLGSEETETLYGSCSPVSTCEDFNHAVNMTSEDEQSVQENVSELDQLVALKLELLPKQVATCTKSLRLFGKNLSIMDVEKPSTSSASSSNPESQDTSQELTPERAENAGLKSHPMEIGSQALKVAMV
ncbi:hypothetical protein V2J09_019675 [Rumex salicifolius]